MRNRTLDALSVLLPAGALGVSVALAAVRAEALPLSGAAAAGSGEGVAARLKAIRDGVSEITGEDANAELADKAEGYPNVLKAWWRNGGWGWRNGGWRNGGWGWRNGGWHPWRNGGWHPWRNGGWRNGGWRNWRNW